MHLTCSRWLIVVLTVLILAYIPLHTAYADTDVSIKFDKYENGTKAQDFEEPYITFSPELYGAGMARAWGGSLQLYGGGTVLTIALVAPASKIQLDGIDLSNGPCTEKIVIELLSNGSVIDSDAHGYCEGQFPYKKAKTFDSLKFHLGGDSSKGVAAYTAYIHSITITFPNLPTSKAGPTVAPTGTPTQLPTIAPTSEASSLQPGIRVLVDDIGNPTLALYAVPNLKQPPLTQLLPGTSAVVTIGPVTQKSQIWWRIRVNRIEGWVLSTTKGSQGEKPTLIPYSTHVLDQLTKQYTNAIATKPTSNLYFRRGLIHFNRDEDSLALEDLNHALEITPNNAIAIYYMRGLILSHQKQLNDAVDSFTKSIDLNAKESIFYNARGEQYLALKNYSAALADFNQAIKLNPTFATAFNNRGVLYLRTNNQSDGEEDFRKAIEIDEYFSFAYQNIGEMYLQQRDVYSAIQVLDKSISVEPNNAEAYVDRGIAYEGQYELIQSLQDFNTALQIDPNNFDALLSRGNLYFVQRNYGSAKSDFLKATQVTADNKCLACALYNLGIVSNAEGDTDKAIDYYTQALAADPNYVAAYINRAHIYKRLGNLEAAQADIKKANELGASIQLSDLN